MFSRPLIIHSVFSVSETRARVRAFAAFRDLSELEIHRRRQIVEWRLSRANEDFLFQPEYGDTLNVAGARFVALVEPAQSGSRIRGRVSAAPVTRVLSSAFTLALLVAAISILAQGGTPAANVVTAGLAIIAGTLLVVRYSVRCASRRVEARLRQALEISVPRAAA